MNKTHWYDLYLFGVRLGIASMKAGDKNIGLRSLLNPVRSGFNRYIEAPYALNSLKFEKNDRVLDISSPKHIALYIKESCPVDLTSIDIVSDFISDYKKYARNMGLSGISWEVRDARKLEYKNDSFDKIYSISVLEHISDDGDILTVREIGRMLKPGGICAITVPFSGTFKEIYKNTSVYERDYNGKPVFFSRIYDEQSLEDRLIVPSGLQEVDRIYYCDRIYLEALWERLPRFLQMSLHWAGPFFASLCYKRVKNKRARKDRNGFCCITLKKNSKL